MAEERIFVGRKAELKRFDEVLRDPAGQAILVVGQQGMGKTWFLDKIMEQAGNHSELTCAPVRYDVTSDDSVDSILELMIEHAYKAAQVPEKSLDRTERRLRQWKALLKLIKIDELVMSLVRDPKRNTRDQFIERLELVSARMPDKGRAIFAVDPVECLHPKSAEGWAIVVRQLPPRVKLVFAQREHDVLAQSRKLTDLENVKVIPVDVLLPDDLAKLVGRRLGADGAEVDDLALALGKFDGHPYATSAALELVIEKGVPLDDIRGDPSGVAEEQWREVRQAGEDAIRLFEAYAILEVAVPDEVAEAVSAVGPARRKELLADRFLDSLIRAEEDGKRIYHTILADHVRDRIGKKDSEAYHTRAIDEYRRRLTANVKPDALAATRLAEHVLAAEGQERFFTVLSDKCTEPLLNLGLLDKAEDLLARALDLADPGSKNEAIASGNLGVIHQTRGRLDRAEESMGKALHVHKRLGRPSDMAIQYGNLGLVHGTRGELERAEEFFKTALEIFEQLGWLEGMASQYGNLGNVYLRRSELDRAEEMLRKALEIFEHLGRMEGMANQYGNLGLVYRTRGELDKAEGMLKKALEINEKVGRAQGMASDYSNLGLIYQTRGELDKAEGMHKNSLEINEKIGRLEGMANAYGNLGNIYSARGELDKAEEYLRKSLDIDMKLGRLEGIANACGNLGLIAEKRGDFKKAREVWAKARDLYAKIGMPHMVKQLQGWLDELPDDEG